jgi:hypothetical protein
VAKPDTILGWYRRLIARKFDGSKHRCYPGRPRHGLAPAPQRSQNTSWKEFIRSHMAVLAGFDFFTVEVLTLRDLVTYYVLFFIHLESRRVSLAGITRHPDELWMQQMAATRATKDGDISISVATCCTIAIQNSAHRSGRHWLLAGSKQLSRLRTARI